MKFWRNRPHACRAAQRSRIVRNDVLWYACCVVKNFLALSPALSLIAALLMPFFAFAQDGVSRVIVPVPFTSQAPAGNWSQPWQDFCEEASVVMAAHFVWGLPLSRPFAELEMKIVQQYEDLVFGRRLDISADETAEVMRRLYRLQDVSVRSVSSPEVMKEELTKGRILIVPVAGRMLGNPYFKFPGPFFHMLIVKGFDNAKNVFIANDPGTRRGESYSYNQQKLFAAIHDWNDGDVLKGEKKMVVVGR